MTEPTFVTVPDAFAHHEAALLRHGGKIGLLSEGSLESAVAAPRNRFLYEGDAWGDRAGVAALAATYWVHVALSHAFADGNKRVGLACFLDFLYRNGYDVALSADEATALGLAIAAREIDREAVARRILPRLCALG